MREFQVFMVGAIKKVKYGTNMALSKKDSSTNPMSFEYIIGRVKTL
jgi:hypothetical protein